MNMNKINYLNYVISIIDKSGNEINLPVNENDTKHINAFLRLAADNRFDTSSLMRYIDNNEYNITGFELSKFLTAEGNIVLCHTDVHNYLNGAKEFSFMRPEVITPNQYNRLRQMSSSLLDYDVYYGIVHYKNEHSQKIIYQRVDYDIFMNYFMLTQENGEKYAKR